MHRLKFDLKLQVPPKPCEIFDLAGGTGTGGYASEILAHVE